MGHYATNRRFTKMFRCLLLVEHFLIGFFCRVYVDSIKISHLITMGRVVLKLWRYGMATYTAAQSKSMRICGVGLMNLYRDSNACWGVASGTFGSTEVWA